jgi:hypothetical protein
VSELVNAWIIISGLLVAYVLAFDAIGLSSDA